jgi:hypothetical protein
LKGDSHERSATLRRSFRPKRITTLLVGESPPHGGTFFYKHDSRPAKKKKDESMLGRRIGLSASVAAIYEAVSELEARYPGRKMALPYRYA